MAGALAGKDAPGFQLVDIPDDNKGVVREKDQGGRTTATGTRRARRSAD